MVFLRMEDFRDRQVWREARLLTAFVHQVSDSFPPAWSVKFREGAVGLLVALTNVDQSSSQEASRLCDRLMSDLLSAYQQKLIDPELFERLNGEATLLKSLLKQNPSSTRR